MFDINDKRVQETTWTSSSKQLEVLLSYLPDMTPCCLASISRKPCIEVRIAIQLICNSEFFINHRFSYTENYYYYPMKLLKQMKDSRPKIPHCESFSFLCVYIALKYIVSCLDATRIHLVHIMAHVLRKIALAGMQRAVQAGASATRNVNSFITSYLLVIVHILQGPRRLKGCQCKRTKSKLACSANSKCPCFRNQIECDPDICVKCQPL
jgi:hypothetical protein